MILDTPVPALEVGEQSKRYIREISFDDVRYAEYLLARGASEEHISKLKIKITDDDVHVSAIANYSPMILGDPKIRLSPTRLPANINKQNHIIIHESEHFAWDSRHPYASRAHSCFSLGALASGTLASGGLFAHAGYEMFDSTTQSVQAVGSGAVGLAFGLAFGAVGSFLTVKALNGFSPDEINAMVVSKREVKKHDPFIEIDFK